MTRNDTGVFRPPLVRVRGLIYVLTLQFVNLTECMRRWHELQSQNTTANSNSPSNQWAFEEVGTKALTSPIPANRGDSKQADSNPKCTSSIKYTLLSALILPPQAPTITLPLIRRLMGPYQTQWWTNFCVMLAT